MFSRGRIELKTDQQLKHMDAAGSVLCEALDTTVAAARPGVTTGELNEIFAESIAARGAVPNFLNYHGFPGHICTSVNDEVVHGIPGERVLEVGDVLKIDAGCIVQGWHSDSARTVILGSSSSGTADPEDERLSAITRAALWHGIAAFATAKHIGEIGEAVEDYVNSQPGKPLGILEDYVGHGIGSAMHLPPDVFNYATGMKGAKIKPGMALAIEPMLVRGSIETKVLSDEWTVVTADAAHASQWEHSVCRHRDGVWVLTAPDGGAADLEPLGVTPVPIP
ncbi:type I methionyl aminopeptidase [Nesterenkonia sphaerica]|uniref:Methionine aminopeptidase n=1 Tax=Nesterenkonia sphaerica TaxID=1804988 RepID=A0A5R9AEV6_9MICC|nr:type I methionyl aminopeptidase [Nesterenkonia sphaerica]TLP77143.1 type I methionyl aminopeptidase [Nesterenkonia sphaerica]